MVLNAFKHLACASFASGFGFKQADALKAAAGSRVAVAAPAAAEKKVEAKNEEVVEEEVDMDMGDLFGY